MTVLEKFIITKPKSGLDKHKVLCLYVSGFQKLIYEYVHNFNWIPLRKLSWITNNCNVIFVGIFVVSRIPQEANSINCNATLTDSVSGIRTCKRNPQTKSGFRILFVTEVAYEQLKASAGILI